MGNNPQNNRRLTSLPVELQHDIFARLPSKPLHICKSVSKQWYSIITSPEFAHFHLLHSRSSPRSNRLLVSISNNELSSLELDTGNPNNDAIFPFSKHTNITSPKGEYQRSLNLVGSCNGLICFKQATIIRRGSNRGRRAIRALYQDNLFVYNPFTRGPIREVPMPVVDSEHKFYGFGYDAVADDYKIMLVHSRRPTAYYYLGRRRPCVIKNYETKVFSLRSMSWKQVDDFCYAEMNGENFDYGKFVEGNLHWGVALEDYDDDNYDQRISPNFDLRVLRFDLSCEKYTFLMLPTELSKVDEEVGAYVFLEVLEGNLCLQVMKYGENDHCDVWVMKEYGVKESWARLFSIGCPIDRCSLRMITVVAYSTSGDRVLVIRDGDYYWYDTDGNDRGEAGINVRARNSRRSYYCGAAVAVASIVCNPSLVSPFSE